jgi:polyphenol oxidase
MTSSPFTKTSKVNAVMHKLQLIQPEWPLPEGVRAVYSTRQGGHSLGVYAGANLGDHVGDNPTHVEQNREQLAAQCGVQCWPWLQQVHGTDIVEVSTQTASRLVADGSITSDRGVACAVLTADCLPILMCSSDGAQVAAVHAGWRGLAAGIVEQGVARFRCNPDQITVYLGPAIGPNHFEVGEDVLQAFRLWGIDHPIWQQLFVPKPTRPKHYLANLFGLTRWRLRQLGIMNVFGGDLCTYSDPQRFYSYRRDGVTGRMVSAIWRV